MKINKKKLFSGMILPLIIAIVLVSAALLIEYGFFSQSIDVNQPISVAGTSDTIDCDAGEICRGGSFTISNDGDSKREVVITNDATEGEIDVEYIGTLTLTEKTVDFSKDVWETLTTPNEVEIEYIVVNGKFSAEVITNVNENYELIYYKDNSDRFNSPAEAISVGDVEGNLPYDIDRNSEADGTYDYCDTNEYVTCHGAKIWYVPSDAINSDGTLQWNRASEFYFETELIQFNIDGKIIIYPNWILDLTPEYTLNELLAKGIYTVDTTISPA